SGEGAVRPHQLLGQVPRPRAVGPVQLLAVGELAEQEQQPGHAETDAYDGTLIGTERGVGHARDAARERQREAVHPMPPRASSSGTGHQGRVRSTGVVETCSSLHSGGGTFVVRERTCTRSTTSPGPAASARSRRITTIRRREDSDSAPRPPTGRFSSSWVATKKSQARRSSFCWVWLGSRLPSMILPPSADRSYQRVVRTPPSAVRMSARTWREMFCCSGLGANSFQFCSNSG